MSDELRGSTPPPIMIKKNDRIYYGEDSWTLEEILQNHEIAKKARAMKNYGDAVELMEWIKNHV